MSISTDALVTEQDIERIKADLAKGYWATHVMEAIGQEPELLLLVSEHFARMLEMVADVLPEEQREQFGIELSLLVWSPLIVLGRAHRRLWEGFLPLENTNDEAMEDSE